MIYSVCNNPNRKRFSDLIQKIRTSVPAIISSAPEADFIVMGSFKKIADNNIAKATLNLSIGATCDTLPICRALK